MDIQMILKLNMKKYRKQLGITQEKAAELTKINIKRWQKIEYGKFNVTLKTLTRIATGLQIDIHLLLKP